ncbi:molybdopterin-guanine dinucleotide biosynthesis protein MobB [Terrihabitans soli]|uniref:Molybdopterin-guanine dinucleotide biosynthesis protein MobB n=1 Tax=Terrihabitans soli TaxID=708113 RepID=A0A6S6QNJ7_9HYPH|nr:molybdopterin-guanine dinucleotide biosynthesis protein B [Terrihabitans soli]BCJ92094.1 molybdopterin-guanine dinucleotide biosynthesis protein MobB [Terrihabitans soli]
MLVIGLAGWSGAGKTTLLEKLIPELTRRGLSVSTMKHAHHNFDVDKPGKDSFVHRQAGAREVLIASANRFALMHELRGAPEPALNDLIGKLSPVDLVIIEGYKTAPHPKIEIWRAANGKDFIHPKDQTIRAIAADEKLTGLPIPAVDLNDAKAVADLILTEARPLAEIFRT